jgi:transposase
MRAELFHRFQLGRTLDAAEAYGGDLFLPELALGVWAREGIALRCNHLDPTSCSLSGAYLPESDAQAMTITHGYARDHRPDFKPAVWALMVSPDGGRPCGSPRWDGKTSDIAMFQARAQALVAALTKTPSPRSRIADAPRYHEDTATHLRPLGFITRSPTTLGPVSEASTQALALDCWRRLDDHTR